MVRVIQYCSSQNIVVKLIKTVQSRPFFRLSTRCNLSDGFWERAVDIHVIVWRI